MISVGVSNLLHMNIYFVFQHKIRWHYCIWSGNMLTEEVVGHLVLMCY